MKLIINYIKTENNNKFHRQNKNMITMKFDFPTF